VPDPLAETGTIGQPRPFTLALNPARIPVRGKNAKSADHPARIRAIGQPSPDPEINTSPAA